MPRGHTSLPNDMARSQPRAAWSHESYVSAPGDYGFGRRQCKQIQLDDLPSPAFLQPYRAIKPVAQVPQLVCSASNDGCP